MRMVSFFLSTKTYYFNYHSNFFDERQHRKGISIAIKSVLVPSVLTEK